MGSSYVNTLVACDSSFMIHSLKEFHIPGIDYTFSINTTHVAMLLVSIFIIIMAVIARVKINKVKPDDTPGMFQNAIEIIVEMLGTMVDGIMGKNANKFVNYISTLFLFIIISNISGLFGLRPPTADYGVTLCLGLITFILGYVIRLIVMLVMFTVLYVFDLGDLLFAILGMFSMKVAAYIQPFTDKLINKIKKGR